MKKPDILKSRVFPVRSYLLFNKSDTRIFNWLIGKSIRNPLNKKRFSSTGIGAMLSMARDKTIISRGITSIGSKRTAGFSCWEGPLFCGVPVVPWTQAKMFRSDPALNGTTARAVARVGFSFKSEEM